MKQKAMNFLGKAGRYGNKDVHDGLVCQDFAKVAANRIQAKHAPAQDAEVKPLTVDVLGSGNKL